MKQFLITLLGLVLCSSAAKAQQGTHLQSRLDSLLLDPMFETSQVGIMVYDLTADTVVYTHGHRQLLRPASTMKLLTAVTALREVGTDYQLHTEIRIDGFVSDSTLYGSLTCIGGMDPSFDSQRMNELTDSLLARGIKTIQGSVIADRTMKDTLLLGEGWCWDDNNPVLSPLLYNRKDRFVEELCGRYAHEVEIRNKEEMMKAEAQDSLHSSFFLPTSLAERILPPMLKKSDNLYAESVLYQVAAQSGTPFATARQAQQAEKRLIEDLGLHPADYRLADGSGLSPYNYLSAELLVRLLRYVYNTPKLFSYIQPALPIAGIDGTLKDRMKKTPAQGNIWAKTGTLTGVSSLAGYALAANGHMLAFAIINQGVRSNRVGRDFQDRFCIRLCSPSQENSIKTK